MTKGVWSCAQRTTYSVMCSCSVPQRALALLQPEPGLKLGLHLWRFKNSLTHAHRLLSMGVQPPKPAAGTSPVSQQVGMCS